jgi:MinD-like ATPase involved in chromosome partitioning or flagellar assembly
MKTEVLLAINDSEWELEMGRAISESPYLKISRRCVDLSEVLTMLEIDNHQAVIFSSELPGLDLAAIARVKEKNCLVIGVFKEGEFGQAEFLSEIEVGQVISFTPNSNTVFLNNLIFCLNQFLSIATTEINQATIPGLIAVWGAEGAPGRTSLAIDLATRLNGSDSPSLLIDADVQAPSIGASLGIAEEFSGISAALHLAQSGKLNQNTLAECLKRDLKELAVLTGILNPNRWIEMRSGGLEKLLKLASGEYTHQIIDINASLPDQRDSNFPEFDSTVRFGHLKTIFRLAEKIIFVAKASPLGIIRTAEILQNQNLFEAEKLLVVVNQVNHYAFSKYGTKLIEDVLHRFVPAHRIWYHQAFNEEYAQAWLKGVSGYSLVKGESGLESIFDELKSTGFNKIQSFEAKISKPAA